MIVEFFLDIIYWLVGVILTPIQFTFEPLGSMAGLIELLATASIFIPFPTLGTCLLIWYGYYFTRFVVVALNWFIGKIPTID